MFIAMAPLRHSRSLEPCVYQATIVALEHGARQLNMKHFLCTSLQCSNTLNVFDTQYTNMIHSVIYLSR